MTRQNLVDILKMNGSYQQIEEAIAEKELTVEERERILDFLKEENPDRAQELFEVVLKDVNDAPIYESAKDEKNDWKALRVQLAQEIRDLKSAELHYQSYMDEYDKSLSDISERYGKEMADVFEKNTKPMLQENAEALSIATKQHSALALMYAEAKSREAQARAAAWHEATQPTRDALSNGWHAVSERAVSTYTHMHNLHVAKKNTKDLDYHPIQDTLNKIRLAHARSHIKESNKLMSKIDKVEQKLIKEANKISKKEFRKEQFLNKLEHWSKGEPVRNEERREIKTVEQARTLLGESKLFSDKKLESMEKSLDDLKEMYTKSVQRAEHSIEKVAEVLRSRRENVQNIAQGITEQYRNGEFGNGTRTIGQIGRNLESGMNATFVQEASLSNDLSKFMETHGFEDLLPGYEGPILKAPQPEIVPEQEVVIEQRPMIDRLTDAMNTKLAVLSNGEQLTLDGDLNPNMIALVNDDNTAKVVISPDDLEEGMHIQVECDVIHIDSGEKEHLVIDIDHFNIDDVTINELMTLEEAPEYDVDIDLEIDDHER